VAAVHKSNSKILEAVKDNSFSFWLPAETENIVLVSVHDQTWSHYAVRLSEIQAKALKFILNKDWKENSRDGCSDKTPQPRKG
jgi:hypothetical protein